MAERVGFAPLPQHIMNCLCHVGVLRVCPKFIMCWVAITPPHLPSSATGGGRLTFEPLSSHHNKKHPQGVLFIMAERVGFEPTDACASPVFKTGTFNQAQTPLRITILNKHSIASIANSAFSVKKN